MKKNDTFTMTIEDMGINGEGIGHYDGMTFFVKDAIIGDVITASITKLKKNYGYARIVEIVKAGVDRVEPKCSIARPCGGCQIQALSYEKQLELKSNKVYNNLLRIGDFDKEQLENVFEPIIGMEEPYHYRNKAQFPVGLDKDGNIVMGFYAARSHQIIPAERCYLGVPINEQVLEIIRDYMLEYHVMPYSEETHKGQIRHVLIRYGFTSKEILVCLVVNGTSLAQEEKLCEALAKLEGMTSISINTNTDNTNVILGEVTRTIWGQDYISDTIHRVAETEQQNGVFEATGEEVTFQISPQSFYQVNPIQTEKLYSTALEYAGLTGKETVWDLYCGIGTISLFLAQKAKKVCGVEIVPKAIEDAKRNASLNHIDNTEFFVGKAEEVLPEFYQGAQKDVSRDNEALHPDVIVVDPPRKGCDELCLDTMIKMKPQRIVYVSCDSATLARDLKVLCQGGYQLKRVRPVDQFCHSMHVESVVLMSRVQK